MSGIFFSILKLTIILGIIMVIADRPGTAHIAWHDYTLDTSAAFLGFCIFGFGYIILTLHRFITAPKLWMLRRKINQMHRADIAWEGALTAIAQGNPAIAIKHIAKARKNGKSKTLIHFLQSQVAMQIGNQLLSTKLLTTLSEESENTMLGYRGLIGMAMRENNWDEVARLLPLAHNANPDAPWLAYASFTYYARMREWQKSMDHLNIAARAKIIPHDFFQKNMATLWLAIARSQAHQDNNKQAIQSAEKALKFYPAWIPATLNLAEIHHKMGATRSAGKVLERAFTQSPHPQILDLWQKITPHLNPLAFHRQIEKIPQTAKDKNPMAQYLLAQTAIKAGLWGVARENLVRLSGHRDAPKSIYALLGDLERMENHDPAASAQWLAKIPNAPDDPHWQCTHCTHKPAQWNPTCTACDSFNTIHWHESAEQYKNDHVSSNPNHLIAA